MSDRSDLFGTVPAVAASKSVLLQRHAHEEGISCQNKAQEGLQNLMQTKPEETNDQSLMQTEAEQEILLLRSMIGDLPKDCRPYEKCERFGAGALSDAELLAVILQSGHHNAKSGVRKSALYLAEELLSLSDTESGLLFLKHGTVGSFRQIEGIGTVKAVRLACVSELCERIWRERHIKRIDLKTPHTVADYYQEELRHLNQERVCIMLLDGRDNFQGSVTVSQGTVNLSVLSAREIFYQAISHRAASFILVHNHPSGDTTPSKEDKQFTSQLFLLGQMMNVPLKDSLIIGDGGYYSFLESGMLGKEKVQKVP